MGRYLLVDLKIMARIPIALFFSLAFPLVLLTIMMISYGNVDIGNGYRFVDKYFLISAGIGILPTALISFPLWLAARFDDKSAKRLAFFRVKIPKLIFADVLAHVILGAAGIALNIIFALVLFQLKIPGPFYFFAFMLQYFFVLLVYLLAGAVLAVIFAKQQVLLPLGMILMFLLFMFSGAFAPFDSLPQGVRDVSAYLPIKYVMNDFFNIWTGKNLSDPTGILMSGLYVLCSVPILLVAWRIRRRRI